MQLKQNSTIFISINFNTLYFSNMRVEYIYNIELEYIYIYM